MENLHIKIPKELKDRFDTIAREKALNKSQVLRNLIEDYIKQEEGR